MKDRLKFRIFCKSENKMMLFNNPTLINGEVGEGGLLFKNYDHKITNVQEMSPDDFVVMQATGIKDKNGTLIFEGDVLREIYDTGEGDTGVDYTQVKWDENSAGFVMFRPDLPHDITYFDDVDNWEDYDVLGNIYQEFKNAEELWKTKTQS